MPPFQTNSNWALCGPPLSDPRIVRLRELVATHGATIRDPQRRKGLLADYLPEDRQAQYVLADFAEDGLLAPLRNLSSDSDVSAIRALIAQTSARFITNRPYTEDAARWAATAWAAAHGLEAGLPAAPPAEPTTRPPQIPRQLQSPPQSQIPPQSNTPQQPPPRHEVPESPQLTVESRTPKRRRTGVVLAVVLSVVVVLPMGIALLVGMLSGGGDPEPANYGDDARHDFQYEQCFRGAMAACDSLYMEAPTSSTYSSAADVCGLWAPSSQYGDCEALDWTADGSYGDDDLLDVWQLTCAAGDMDNCDQLMAEAPDNSTYYAFASGCGGRSENANGLCSEAESEGRLRWEG